MRFTLFLSIITALLSPSVFARQADSSRNSRDGFLVLPIVFYSPETKIAGGATLLFFSRDPHDPPEARPTTITFVAIYTQLHQFTTTATFESYPMVGEYKIETSLTAERYPSLFYGIGKTGRTPGESYTPQRVGLETAVQRRLTENVRTGLSIHWERLTVSTVPAGSFLSSGNVPGGSGSTVAGLGILTTWDTRDNIYQPASGRFYSASLARYGEVAGGEFTYTKLKVDAREYLTVGERQVLAAQFLGVVIDGVAPFRELARMGGTNTMRGYYDGRYRDNALLCLQAEYRMPLFWRIGGVVFAGAGEVARNMWKISPDAIRFSGGAGLRYEFDQNERLTIRLDAGWGENSSGVYVTALEAF